MKKNELDLSKNIIMTYTICGKVCKVCMLHQIKVLEKALKANYI